MSTFSTRYGLQTGTIPTGVTSSGSKYPINVPDVSIDDPNYFYGPTHTPFVSMLSVTSNFNVRLDGDWSGKIKTGDPIEIVRGSIRNEYSIRTSVFDPGATCTNLSLSNLPGVVQLLDSFIGSTGYDNPSYDSYIALARAQESPNSPDFSLVKSFSVQMVPDENPDTFSLNTSWKVDPSVKATRMRWRSVPRNSSVSSLSFAVSSQGIYSQLPSATVQSSSGRKAEIQITGSLVAVGVSAGGTGYTSAFAYSVGGGGTGASFSVSISSGQVNGISVVAGGTGYSSLPSLVIVGDGSGASAQVSQIITSGVNIVQQGGNYLSVPTVAVSSQFLVGLTASQITASLSLSNQGRVDYLRVLNSGAGYTGASVGITGSLYFDNATAVAEIEDGSITNIRLTYSGHGYNGSTASPIVSISATGTGGSGASAIANVDIYSKWVYESPSSFNEFSRVLSGFKYNVPYEIEILASQDQYFRNLVKYVQNTNFQYYKLA